MVSVTRTVFGELPSGGGTVEKFQLRSDQLSVDIISWGCTITALQVKDRQGKASDVVLGFAELEGGSRPAQGYQMACQIGPGTLLSLRTPGSSSHSRDLAEVPKLGQSNLEASEPANVRHLTGLCGWKKTDLIQIAVGLSLP